MSNLANRYGRRTETASGSRDGATPDGASNGRGASRARSGQNPRRWTFIFNRRWLAYFAAAVIFAVACVFLSQWQQHRGAAAAEANALVNRNWSATPVQLTSVLPSATSFDANAEWARVTASGSYLPSQQYLVRNRPTDAGAGVEVLTPFRMDDGRVFIVDRGWIASPNSGVLPKDVPTPPSGTVTVTVRLQASEPTIPHQGEQNHSIGTVNLPQMRELISAAVGGEVYTGMYGQLTSQTPKASVSLTPVVSSPPQADTGMHWSYMIQWLIFAAIGFFGLGYAIRLEYRKRGEVDEEWAARDTTRQAEKIARQAARGKLTDSDIEDAALASPPPGH